MDLGTFLVARLTKRVFPVMLGLIVHVMGSGVPTSSEDHLKVRKCEPIRLEMCQGLGYNVTGLPNFVGHESQPEADLQLRTFTPLIQYGCSADLRFFLCAVYAPMCTEKVVEVIGPCRSVCENVRERCQPVLEQFGFPWPNALNCSKFHPKNNNQHMCMEGPTPDSGHLQAPSSFQSLPWGVALPPAPTSASRSGLAPTAAGCQHLPYPERFVYNNRTQRCLLLCHEDFRFQKKDKDVMDIWLSVWSVVTLLATFFVDVTFLIDVDRFPFIERQVVFMSTCYGMCSVAYLVRVIAGRHAISCVSVEPPNGHVTVLGENGQASTDCTILFVLLYYFVMAGIIWWMVLTFTWLLVAGLNCSVDAVQRLGTYFHIAAWTVPAIKVIIILIRKNIEPNEFTGLCHVTPDDSMAVVGFLLAPMSAYFFIGVTFLFGGLLGHCQQGKFSRAKPRDDADATRREPGCVRSSATRVASFSLACAVPLIGMIACVLYGYMNMERSWERTSGGRGSDEDDEEDDLDHHDQQHQQSVSVFLIQVLMSMLVGIFTAFRLILDADTKRSWKEFFQRRCPSSTPDDGRGGGGVSSRERRLLANTPAGDFQWHRGSSASDKNRKQQYRGLNPGSYYDSRSLSSVCHSNVCRTCKKQSTAFRPIQYII